MAEDVTFEPNINTDFLPVESTVSFSKFFQAELDHFLTQGNQNDGCDLWPNIQVKTEPPDDWSEFTPNSRSEVSDLNNQTLLNCGFAQVKTEPRRDPFTCSSELTSSESLQNSTTVQNVQVKKEAAAVSCGHASSGRRNDSFGDGQRGATSDNSSNNSSTLGTSGFLHQNLPRPDSGSQNVHFNPIVKTEPADENSELGKVARDTFSSTEMPRPVHNAPAWIPKSSPGDRTKSKNSSLLQQVSKSGPIEQAPSMNSCASPVQRTVPVNHYRPDSAPRLHSMQSTGSLNSFVSSSTPKLHPMQSTGSINSASKLDPVQQKVCMNSYAPDSVPKPDQGQVTVEPCSEYLVPKTMLMNSDNHVPMPKLSPVQKTACLKSPAGIPDRMPHLSPVHRVPSLAFNKPMPVQKSLSVGMDKPLPDPSPVPRKPAVKMPVPGLSLVQQRKPAAPVKMSVPGLSPVQQMPAVDIKMPVPDLVPVHKMPSLYSEMPIPELIPMQNSTDSCEVMQALNRTIKTEKRNEIQNCQKFLNKMKTVENSMTWSTRTERNMNPVVVLTRLPDNFDSVNGIPKTALSQNGNGIVGRVTSNGGSSSSPGAKQRSQNLTTNHKAKNVSRSVRTKKKRSNIALSKSRMESPKRSYGLLSNVKVESKEQNNNHVTQVFSATEINDVQNFLLAENRPKNIKSENSVEMRPNQNTMDSTIRPISSVSSNCAALNSPRLLRMLNNKKPSDSRYDQPNMTTPANPANHCPKLCEQANSLADSLLRPQSRMSVKTETLQRNENAVIETVSPANVSHSLHNIPQNTRISNSFADSHLQPQSRMSVKTETLQCNANAVIESVSPAHVSHSLHNIPQNTQISVKTEKMQGDRNTVTEIVPPEAWPFSSDSRDAQQETSAFSSDIKTGNWKPVQAVINNNNIFDERLENQKIKNNAYSMQVHELLPNNTTSIKWENAPQNENEQIDANRTLIPVDSSPWLPDEKFSSSRLEEGLLQSLPTLKNSKIENSRTQSDKQLLLDSYFLPQSTRTNGVSLKDESFAVENNELSKISKIENSKTQNDKQVLLDSYFVPKQSSRTIGVSPNEESIVAQNSENNVIERQKVEGDEIRGQTNDQGANEQSPGSDNDATQLESNEGPGICDQAMKQVSKTKKIPQVNNKHLIQLLRPDSTCGIVKMGNSELSKVERDDICCPTRQGVSEAKHIPQVNYIRLIQLLLAHTDNRCGAIEMDDSATNSKRKRPGSKLSLNRKRKRIGEISVKELKTLWNETGFVPFEEDGHGATDTIFDANRRHYLRSQTRISSTSLEKRTQAGTINDQADEENAADGDEDVHSDEASDYELSENEPSDDESGESALSGDDTEQVTKSTKEILPKNSRKNHLHGYTHPQSSRAPMQTDSITIQKADYSQSKETHNMMPSNQGQQNLRMMLNSQWQPNQSRMPSNQGQQNQNMMPSNQGQPNQSMMPGNQGQPNQSMMPSNQGQQNQCRMPSNQGQQHGNMMPPPMQRANAEWPVNNNVLPQRSSSSVFPIHRMPVSGSVFPTQVMPWPQSFPMPMPGRMPMQPNNTVWPTSSIPQGQQPQRFQNPLYLNPQMAFNTLRNLVWPTHLPPPGTRFPEQNTSATGNISENLQNKTKEGQTEEQSPKPRKKKPKVYPPGVNPQDAKDCKICGKFFMNYRGWEQHMEAQHMKKDEDEKLLKKSALVCEFCGKSFPINKRMKFDCHMRNHNKNLVCSLCSTTWSTMFNLRTHMMSHTGEKPYKCSYCEKGFIRSDNFRNHIKRVHPGEPSYICNECPEKFHTAKELKTHSVVHAKLKPLQVCPICKKKFRDVKQLNKHVKRHNKPNSTLPVQGDINLMCKLCQCLYSNERMLRLHMRKHRLGIIFTCEHCSKSIKLSDTVGEFEWEDGEEKKKLCKSCFWNMSKLKFPNDYVKIFYKAKEKARFRSPVKDTSAEGWPLVNEDFTFAQKDAILQA